MNLVHPLFQVWTKFFQIFWSEGTNFWSPRPKFLLDHNFHDSSYKTHFNLKGSSIPTISELQCCSFRSRNARLTDGRCSSFIPHIEHLPSVNLVWHDPKLQHSSSDMVGIEEPCRLNVVCPLRIPPSRNVAHLLRIIMTMDINTRYISTVGHRSLLQHLYQVPLCSR